MDTSAAWINDYLDPPASPDEQAELLTRAGFPLEGSEEIALPSGGIDVRQDFELTSNRGDCACHLGLAREIAAISGRTLRLPHAAPEHAGPAAAEVVTVENHEKALCPLYTARVIRGVRVGPSPDWLQARLIARGDIPRNNIVDATNFVLFEFGQPTHVFDLNVLKGPAIIIRKAHANEPFLPIGEGAAEVKLSEDDLVIADAERAVAMAGVKGGALTAVSNETTDILIEAATFNPVSVRNTSRRHNISSDSSFRFERGVHPGQVNPAADRLAALILELAGGELLDGVVSDGEPIPERRTVSMRLERCRRLLGVPIDDATIVGMLDRLGFEPRVDAGTAHCAVPIHRLDIEREVDLIEEVGRMFGYDNISIADSLNITVAPPQPTVQARRAVNDALAGMGYLETITHSLISLEAAEAFVPPGMQVLTVDDERAGAEPALRPSVLPSLLRVFAHNRDSGVRDLRLFETAAVFAREQARHRERVNLGLLHSAPSPEEGLRRMRGVIDRLVEIILGPDATTDVEPVAMPWFGRDAAASIHLSDQVLGTFGIIEPKVASVFDIDQPIYAAEIGLPSWYDRYPPITQARALPSFPAIERDISVIIDEAVMWANVRRVVESLALQHCEKLEFVTTFRGRQIGAGRKSLTLRLRFRAPDRTLKHDEVDPQVEQVMKSLTDQFQAEIRTAP